MSESAKPTKWKDRFKKIGIIGFCFFLLKGLAWLGLAAWLFKD